MSEPDQPTFIAPQAITEADRDELLPVWNAQLVQALAPALARLGIATRLAAADHNAERLKEVCTAARGYEAKLSEWNEHAGTRASEAMQALEAAFGKIADDISRSLNGELPGQEEEDSGDDWKKS